MKLLVAYLGKICYKDALGLQKNLLKLRQKDKISDILLLLEHPPVFTVGKSGSEANILDTEKSLHSKGISIFKSNRGGDVTYHGPGQLVGYPIIDLKNYNRSIKNYINKLEKIFIDLLQNEYQISAKREADYIGVWVGGDKILAIGVEVRKWVTMHGFAFNVNPNLAHFQLINPCGITHKGVTSLEKILGKSPSVSDLTGLTTGYFAKAFNKEPIIIEQERLRDIVRRGGGA